MNKVFNMNCLEGMNMLADKSVDMILCDLPYGVLKHKGNPNTQWDVVIPFAPLWEQYKRVAKDNAAILLTAAQPFATDLINSNRAWFKYELIWSKTRASGFLNAKKMPNKAHENVLVFYNQLPTYHPQKYEAFEGFVRRSAAKRKANSKAFKINHKEDYSYEDDGTRFPDSVLEFKSVSRPGMHPTEKPIELFAWLVRSYSNPGDLVLDNCMGSGTTALACIIEGRNFVGFEMDQNYFRMTTDRIEALRRGEKV